MCKYIACTPILFVNFATVYDYIIIGGGLAGTTLAYRLKKLGAEVKLFDEPERNFSSSVAAGIFNPVTGKRMALTWKAAEMFDELHSFYPKIEDETGVKFYCEMPVYKLFESVFEQNEWLNKQEKSGFNKFINSQLQTLKTEKVKNPFGALQILGSGSVNCNPFLEALHHRFTSDNTLHYGHFECSRLEVSKEVIKYENIRSQAIIFCDGAYSLSNQFFNYLPHKPVHGEILEVEIEDFYDDRIISKGVFIMPTEGKKYLVGSTYNWDLTEPVVTSGGKEVLIAKLKEIIKTDFIITAHFAGIRPSSKDRRPYLGQHPVYKNMFIFNGFGSKGVSLIPYLSKVFTNYLLNDAELPAEADICRVRV